MQVMLQITADSPAEMLKVLAAFDQANTTQEETPTNGAAPLGKEPPRRGRPPKVVEPQPETAPETQTVTQETAKPETTKPVLKVVEKEPAEVEPEKVTIAQVRNALTSFLAANSEPAAAKLLLTHGHTDRLSKLKQEYFHAVYTAATLPVVKDAPKMFDDDIPDMTGKG